MLVPLALSVVCGIWVVRCLAFSYPRCFAGGHNRYTINEHQWTKLQARDDVRLVERDRGSRTIIASYRNAQSTFCEFVGGEEETKQIASGTRRQLSRPPRFFTEREVARLQGFPESFVTEWCGPCTLTGPAPSPLLCGCLSRSVQCPLLTATPRLARKMACDLTGRCAFIGRGNATQIGSTTSLGTLSARRR